jgi:hypothetical protein
MLIACRRNGDKCKPRELNRPHRREHNCDRLQALYGGVTRRHIDKTALAGIITERDGLNLDRHLGTWQGLMMLTRAGYNRLQGIEV